MKTEKISGITLILFSLSFMTRMYLGNQKSSLGFTDSDNPSVMIRFLQEHLDIFTYTGIIGVVLGIFLTLTVLTFWEIFSKDSSSLYLKFGTLIGFFASAYFFSDGVLRIQAPGTLLHMDNYNHDGISGICCTSDCRFARVSLIRRLCTRYLGGIYQR